MMACGMGQFVVSEAYDDDDFDKVYAANVQTHDTGAVSRDQPDDVTLDTPPPSPGEKIVLVCGPKAIDIKRYQRDYVIGAEKPRHVTKNRCVQVHSHVTT